VVVLSPIKHPLLCHFPWSSIPAGRCLILTSQKSTGGDSGEFYNHVFKSDILFSVVLQMEVPQSIPSIVLPALPAVSKSNRALANLKKYVDLFHCVYPLNKKGMRTTDHVTTRPSHMEQQSRPPSFLVTSKKTEDLLLPDVAPLSLGYIYFWLRVHR
jgi:hypothetical protein